MTPSEVWDILICTAFMLPYEGSYFSGVTTNEVGSDGVSTVAKIVKALLVFPLLSYAHATYVLGRRTTGRRDADRIYVGDTRDNDFIRYTATVLDRENDLNASLLSYV